MFDVLRARWQQGHRTMKYPAGPPPELPERFAGRPTIDAGKCAAGCEACVAVCPTDAIVCGAGVPPAERSAGSPPADAAGTAAPQDGRVQLDLGKCLFCRACQTACPSQAIEFTRDYRLAARRRDDLIVSERETAAAELLDETARRLFGRSLKLRQVSAGGCNACEADTNVLGTIGWDLGRFGIQFVASPRHADGLLITGPVTANMALALQKTYEAVPSPKMVIAVGSCAIAGGPYAGHTETADGAAGLLPVDLFVPGCPPHPLTILDALLRFLGKEV
jgi:Ni,Fe-hydrogenase III small subunit/ferredoxin